MTDDFNIILRWFTKCLKHCTYSYSFFFKDKNVFAAVVHDKYTCFSNDFTRSRFNVNFHVDDSCEHFYLKKNRFRILGMYWETYWKMFYPWENLIRYPFKETDFSFHCAYVCALYYNTVDLYLCWTFFNIIYDIEHN